MKARCDQYPASEGQMWSKSSQWRQDVVKIQPVKARFQNFFLQFMGINTTIISILYIHDNSEEKLNFFIAKNALYTES